MLARRRELNTQLHELIGAHLLAVSLWLAYVLRLYGTCWFNLENMVDPLLNYQSASI
jgi:hypothetical protein